MPQPATHYEQAERSCGEHSQRSGTSSHRPGIPDQVSTKTTCQRPTQSNWVTPHCRQQVDTYRSYQTALPVQHSARTRLACCEAVELCRSSCNVGQCQCQFSRSSQLRIVRRPRPLAEGPGPPEIEIAVRRQLLTAGMCLCLHHGHSERV